MKLTDLTELPPTAGHIPRSPGPGINLIALACWYPRVGILLCLLEALRGPRKVGEDTQPDAEKKNPAVEGGSTARLTGAVYYKCHYAKVAVRDVAVQGRCLADPAPLWLSPPKASKEQGPL